MKHELFLDYMKQTVETWRTNKSLEVLHQNYSGFLATIEAFREDAKRRDNAVEIMNDLFVEFSKGILRALALINAGGIFVIMTIISSLASKESKFQTIIPAISGNSTRFILGLSFAVATMALSYFSQLLYNSISHAGLGKLVHIVAVIFGTLAFVFFICGAIGLSDVFSSQTFIDLLGQAGSQTQ